MHKFFGFSTSIFFLFTDNKAQLQTVINKTLERFPNFRYIVVDEDEATSLALMTLCQHHVVTISSFGVWGAYLDPRQPSGGKTVVHKRFELMHGPLSVPFKEWIRAGEEMDVDM